MFLLGVIFRNAIIKKAHIEQVRVVLDMFPPTSVQSQPHLFISNEPASTRISNQLCTLEFNDKY